MDHLRVIEGVILDSDSESEMLISSAIDELGIGLTEAEPIQIADFPACPESICGSVMRKSDIVQVGNVVQQRRCICGYPTVVGRNKDGRAYLACPQKRCKFFRWADTALDPPYYNLAHNKVSWKAFSPPVYKLLPSDLASLPEYVVQGSLGDCWFLSALVVLCENRARLDRVLGDRNGSFSFCKDGIWKTVRVDEFIPVFTEGKKEGMEAFAKAKDNVIFGPMLEKAYACMYGSYAAISGGWISEALFDLTGSPTETLELDESTDLDMLWVKLNSWRESGFLVGCSTSFTIDTESEDYSGLVAMHAYSVVDTVELFNVRIGRQTKITEFLSSKSTSDSETIPHLRLVKVRNPWGRKEWTGDWSGKSDKWTKSLIERIPSYAQRNMKGFFWMDLRDFTRAFSEIEVAKTHDDWYTQCLKVSRESMWPISDVFRPGIVRNRIKIQSTENLGDTWCYVSLVQPSVRGRPNAYYADLHLAIINCSDRSVVGSAVGRAARILTVELMLPPAPAEYEVVVLSLCSAIPIDVTGVLRIFSAQPILSSISSKDVSPILTSPEFEKMLLCSVPLKRSFNITESIVMSIHSTSGVAVVALTQLPLSFDLGADVFQISVRATPDSDRIETVGRWRHVFDLVNPKAGTIVLGIIVEKRHRGVSDKISLSGYDFEVDIFPVGESGKRPRLSEIIELE